MARYKCWLSLFDDGTAYTFYSENSAIEEQVYLRKKRGAQLIETCVIEWETKGATRVADYLVPDPRISWVADRSLWCKQTHPIGQQPEGSVMVPGSEKLLDE